MKIETLNFSVRTYNVLKRAKIDTVEQLRRLPDDDLMCLRGLGKHCLDEIHEKLERRTITNGDRIRAMSDEELAEFLDFCPYNGCEEADCIKCISNWLKQPAEVEK